MPRRLVVVSDVLKVLRQAHHQHGVELKLVVVVRLNFLTFIVRRVSRVYGLRYVDQQAGVRLQDVVHLSQACPDEVIVSDKNRIQALVCPT